MREKKINDLDKEAEKSRSTLLIIIHRWKREKTKIDDQAMSVNMGNGEEMLSFLVLETSFPTDARCYQSTDDTANNLLDAHVLRNQLAQRIQIEATAIANLIGVQLVPVVDVRAEAIVFLIALPRNRWFASFFYTVD